MTRESVETATADGVVLRGELTRGRGTTWLVFVHEFGGDIDDWRPLIIALIPTEWNLLALDLRGHGGSDGEWDAANGLLDVEAGIDFARNGGAEHVAVVGAGVGAIASLECVSRPAARAALRLADSLVLISPDPLENRASCDLRGEGVAKLIISSALRAEDADADALMRASIGWTVRVTFAATERGTGLLRGPFKEQVADRMRSFLLEQETLGRSRLTALTQARRTSVA